MSAEDRDFAVEVVCTVPKGYAADAVTSDGHVVLFWPQEDGTLRFTWDGIAGVVFDVLSEMRDKTIAVFCSADGAHIAYVGGRGEQMFVGRDNHEDPPIVAFSRSVPPVFTPDGRHLAYGGGTLETYRLILDGEPVGDEQLAPIAAVFSPDGERLAYAEMRGEKRTEAEFRIVLEGVPGEWFAGMRNAPGVMQFSPDSRRFAYCRLGGDLNVQWVIDGAPQRSFTEVPHLSIARLRGVGVLEPPVPACFIPDSRRFAYFADVPEKGVAIVEDDVAGPVVKAVGWPVFSPDSRHLAYTAQTFDGRMALVLDGVLGPSFDAKDTSLPVFSADGRHLAATFSHEEGGFLRKRHLYGIVVDGRVLASLPGEDAGAHPVFSPDGERVAWWLQQDKVRRMYVNGEPYAADVHAHNDPVFTAAGHLVYAARLPDQRLTVAVDGRPGVIADDLAADRSLLAVFGRDLTPAADIPFAVSPDGEHVAWSAKLEGGWRPVLDERVGPAFDVPLTSSFDGDGRATWHLQRDDVVYRVTA